MPRPAQNQPAAANSSSPGEELLSNMSGAEGAPEPSSSAPAPVAPPPESPPTPAPPPAQPGFMDQIRELGFQDVSDEAEARARLLESYRQQQERMSGFESRLKELEPLAKYGTEYLETLRQPRQQPQQQEQPKKYWDPPQFDQTLMTKYQQYDPETGSISWKRDTPAAVRVAAEQHEAYHAAWAQKVIYDPINAFAPMIQEVLDRRLQEVFGTPLHELPYRLDVNGEQRALDEFVDKYESELFIRDPRTNQIDRNHFSPFGEAVDRELRELDGLPAQKRLDKAYALARSQFPAAPALPEKRKQIQRETARRAGAGVPDRSGSEQRQRQNTNLSPGQEFLQRLEGVISS